MIVFILRNPCSRKPRDWLHSRQQRTTAREPSRHPCFVLCLKFSAKRKLMEFSANRKLHLACNNQNWATSGAVSTVQTTRTGQLLVQSPLSKQPELGNFWCSLHCPNNQNWATSGAVSTVQTTRTGQLLVQSPLSKQPKLGNF
jgi:hypothetical protein